MSAYNAMADSSTEREAQPDPAYIEQADDPTQHGDIPEQAKPAASPTQAEAQTAQIIPAQPDAQTLQTPNEQAVPQGATGGRGGGNGGNGSGNRWQGSNGNGTAGAYATSDPQNGFTEWLTMHGTVSAYALPGFTLLSDDGWAIAAQLGNRSYIASLGLTLNNGDAITVIGYWDTSGTLAVGQITIDATGQTYILRDDLGRPLWGGGPNQ